MDSDVYTCGTCRHGNLRDNCGKCEDAFERNRTMKQATPAQATAAPTDLSAATEREAFEAYETEVYKKEAGYEPIESEIKALFKCNHQGEVLPGAYSCMFRDHRWEGWQARASQPSAVPQAVAVPEDVRQFLLDVSEMPLHANASGDLKHVVGVLSKAARKLLAAIPTTPSGEA